MKRLALISLILSGTCWGAIAVVEHPAGVTNSTASTTCAVNVTGASGNLIIMSVAVPTGVTVTGVTDLKSGGTNTYTKGPVADNATGGRVEMWWTLSAGTATTVTAAFASNKNSCAADVYSGVSGVSSVYPTNTGPASGTATITFSTTAANSRPVVAISTAPSTLTYTAGTTGCTTNPCVLESTATGGSTTTPGIGVEDDGNVVAITSRTLTATLSLSTKSWAVGAIELMTTLPEPTLSPNGGSFNNDTSTTFSAAVAGTAPTFCSTLDNSTPAASTPGTCSAGTTGGSTTVIATGTTPKVLATKSGWVNSAVTTGSSFTLTVADPSFGTNGGSFNNDTSSTQSSATTGAIFCQTVDGSTPAASTPGTCSAGATGATITAIATGSTIKALATKSNYVNSAVATSSSFTLTVGAITDSPGAGTYTAKQTITLGVTTTTGATIHYTTNNTTAGCGSASYSSPFLSSYGSENIRAIGCKTNYVSSAEINHLYYTWPTVVWMEAGTAATWGTQFYSAISGTVASDNPSSGGGGSGSLMLLGVGGSSAPTITGERDLKLTGQAINTFAQVSSVLANAGRRISFYFNSDTMPPTSSIYQICNIGGAPGYGLGLSTDGSGVTTLELFSGDDGAAPFGNGTFHLNANTWYRLSIAYTITSQSVNEIRVFVNGAQDISLSNQTLNSSGTVSIIKFGDVVGDPIPTNTHVYYKHQYIDSGAGLDDTGDIKVTAKRPASNSTNQWNTAIGNSPANRWENVSERPVNTSNGWEQTAQVTTEDEDYGIESASQGDVDITGKAVVGITGWAWGFSEVSGGAAPILFNGSTGSALPGATAGLAKSVATTSTYPSNPIGVRSASSSTHATFLYETGMLIAYIP